MFASNRASPVVRPTLSMRLERRDALPRIPAGIVCAQKTVMANATKINLKDDFIRGKVALEGVRAANQIAQ